MNITWRPYQKEIFDAADKAMEKGIRNMGIVSATGTGKRLLGVELSRRADTTLFLCHTEELIEQARKDFEKMYPLQVGIVKGPRFEINKKIVIASAQTIWRRLDKMPKDMFEFVMADEMHHYLAKTYIMPLKHFDYKHMFGFTATPTRLDGLDFSNIIDDIIYDYPLEKAIKEGYLCQLDAIRARTQIDISNVKKSRGDFAIGELDSIVNIPERNKLVISKYLQYARGRQAVAFCTTIQHALDLRDEFRNQGIRCETIHSKIDHEERARINKEYRSGMIDVLTNVNILTEGWDYDNVGCLLLARPTESLALYMQMIGRGTRLKSNEYKMKHMTSSCKVIDFVDNFGSHSLINTWTLDEKKKEEDKVFVTEEKREELIKNRDDIVNQRNARIKKIYGTDKPVNLLNLPDKEVIRRNVHWYNDPITNKQLEFLQKHGVYDENTDYTKGQAANAISSSPAKPWMIRNLIEWGIKVHDEETGYLLDITSGQYLSLYHERKAVEEVNTPNGTLPGTF